MIHGVLAVAVHYFVKILDVFLVMKKAFFHITELYIGQKEILKIIVKFVKLVMIIIILIATNVNTNLNQYYAI